MTVMTERRAQMPVAEFEQLAHLVGKESESVRLEFIDGRIGAKGMPDGDHNEIVRWVARRCMQHRPDVWMYSGDQGLKVERYRGGRARPDGTLAPDGLFAGQGEWADPQGVLMTVEVTSYDADTHRRDREDMPAGYAAAGIPVYLLVDREHGTVTVCSAPDRDKGEYTVTQTVRFGACLVLPEPVGAVLETAELKRFG
ncbi:Uma2 family endonuclease [Streptomyces cacaoi]|uniref:Putative restriction endonuclease domain-containing protein n=1 Tax=Streptomyces cacaoi TaxID=1898 RepID=A0A4Y3R7S6_STRCI|nr:Uma2 family endonuclease [Streptomyces cacaoi]NNG87923.1 Uma2 family endonuclease [Streptomyces cacaoi]GEB51900.1 hypothetical protein SCA03_44510 [Streptomyces cacaoi]